MEQPISFFIAFSAGLLSFISPCVLPVVPSYISYITGLSLEELTSAEGGVKWRERTLKNSVMFILGFSSIFVSFGATATVIGRFFITHQMLIRQIGGILIIFFGLCTMGAVKPLWLMRDLHYHFRSKPVGYLGSYLVGVAFGAGWTPCVGPILGSILLYASASETVLRGMQLLSVYSLGLGLPLLVSSWGMQSFLAYFKRTARYMWLVSGISGAFLIAVGLLIFTNSLTRLTAFFYEMGIGWDIGQ